MEKLLYVTANPKGLEKSKGLKIGGASLESFQQERPDVDIKRMDLFTLDFPQKAVHIQTRGGQYTGTPMEGLESGDRYLKIALRFLGIEIMDSVITEGFDINPQKVPEILAQAKENARLAAEEFANDSVTVLG